MSCNIALPHKDIGQAVLSNLACGLERFQSGHLHMGRQGRVGDDGFDASTEFLYQGQIGHLGGEIWGQARDRQHGDFRHVAGRIQCANIRLGHQGTQLSSQIRVAIPSVVTNIDQ